MLLPGPEAQQLATYIGWLMHRTLGGIMAGGLFVLPGIVAIMALSWIYALYGQVGIVAALFFGLKAAVLAIVLEAVVRIGRRALKNRVMVGIAAAAFVAIFFLDVPFPLIVLAAGLIGFVGGRAGLDSFQVGGGHGAADGNGGPRQPARRRAARACPPDRRRRFKVSAVWLALWLVPVGAILATARTGPRLRADRRASSRRWRWSPSAAPMRCSPTWRSRRSRITAGWRPARCSTASAWPRRRRGR